MNRPEQFLNSLHACFQEFETRATVLNRVLAVSHASPTVRHEWLECHARRYVIDQILEGLGWDIGTSPLLADHLANVQHEVRVTSLQNGQRRFLDYLGCERADGIPLLLVEAKRPQLALTVTESNAAATQHAFGREISRYLCKAHAFAALSGEWRGYLDDLRDYVRSISKSSRTPSRVAISNGEWLVVFVDPQATFCDSQESAEVAVFQDRTSILDNYHHVFNLLAYHELSAKAKSITPEEVSAYVNADELKSAVHALRVVYSSTPGNYRLIPNIVVAPVIILLRGRAGRIVVEAKEGIDFEMPLGNDVAVEDHRSNVSAAANTLKREVERRLEGRRVPCMAIEDYFRDVGEFARQSAVTEAYRVGSGYRRFTILTGKDHHFYVEPADYRNCPFHDFGTAVKNGVQYDGAPITKPSTVPKSFTQSGSWCHCAHKETLAAKTIPITAVNRPQTGQRSALEGEPFCELWKLDEFLCCRTCVFQRACTSSEVFQLPCLVNNADGQLDAPATIGWSFLEFARRLCRRFVDWTFPSR